MVNSALPPQHPDDDLLADLVADVLPTAQARAIESHVLECSRCTALLADAEHVRSLLVRSDPGPMPADVLTRIESALQIEALGRAEQAVPGAPGVPVMPPAPPSQLRAPTPWADTEAIEVYEALARRRSERRADHELPPTPEPEPEPESRPEPEPEAAEPAFEFGPREPLDPERTMDIRKLGEAAAPVTGPMARPARLARGTRGSSRSRRDMRQEVREVKASRRGTVLAAAAGIVLVLGLGAFAIRSLMTSGAPSAQTAAGSAAEGGSPARVFGAGTAPVLSTGTNYTDSGLAAQAHALMKQAATAYTRSAADGAVRTPQASAAPAVPGASTKAGTGTGNLSLRDPQRLRACLQALHATGAEPVAVDLATYNGQEAAVIVLMSNSGGYEVWVVARDCRPGADGTIKFTQFS